MDLNLLAGPAALAIGASVAVTALWREHMRSVALKDAVILKLTDAVAAFPAALKDLTSVVVDAGDREKRRHVDAPNR